MPPTCPGESQREIIRPQNAPVCIRVGPSGSVPPLSAEGHLYLGRYLTMPRGRLAGAYCQVRRRVGVPWSVCVLFFACSFCLFVRVCLCCVCVRVLTEASLFSFID